MTTTSAFGRTVIEHFEGLRFSAYPDVNVPPVWTIGYGHTRGVRKGDTCTSAQADAWLAEDLAIAEREIPPSVTLQHQFDALVSLIFNIGVGNWHNSTLREILPTASDERRALEFTRWNRASGEYRPDLNRRRTIEMVMFLGHDVRGLIP